MVVRVVAGIEIMMVQCSVKPVVEELHWTHMEESGDNYTFGVPKWQMIGPRRILTEQEHKNAVQKDLVIPAIHFTTTLELDRDLLTVILKADY